MTVYPRRGVCWFWAGVVRPGRPYVLCRDLDLAPPADPSVLEVRGHGLWSHAICETPLEHWTVAMEAFAVSLDDPFEAWRTERGDRIGLAFDLEWESVRPPVALAPGTAASGATDGYGLACDVHGELQVGDEQWAVATRGRRTHEWGALVWPDAPPLGETRTDTPLADAPVLVDRPSQETARLRRRLLSSAHGVAWVETVDR